MLKNVEVHDVKILKNVFKCIFNFMCIYFLRLHIHVSICVYTCLFQYLYIRVCLYLNYVCIRVCLCKMVLRLLWFCCEGVFLTEQTCTTWLYSCVAAWVTWRCALWCLSRTMQPWIKTVVGRCWWLETHQNLLQVIGGFFMVFHLHIRILFRIYVCIYICILENDEHAHMDWSKTWFKCERHAVIISILNVMKATTTTHQDKHTQKIQGIAPECFVYARFVFVWRLRNPKSTHLPRKNENTNKNQHMRNTLSLFVYMFLPWEMQNLGSPSFPR